MLKAQEIIFDNLLGRLGSISNKNILDYGCGMGDVIPLLISMSNPKGKLNVCDANDNSLQYVKNVFSTYIDEGRLNVQKVNRPNLIKETFEICFCHNVLECLDNKVDFINQLYDRLKENGVLLLSHIDFDSAIYNSSHKDLTRSLIHFYADTQQEWQENVDGQIGRKLNGLFNQSKFNKFDFDLFRLFETTYDKDSYGYQMSHWITDMVKEKQVNLDSSVWINDLEFLNNNMDYFFAIDVSIIMAFK
ncbi:methyltransferase domain-containing protein [Legionella pneumophila]|uniref:methyltransferase domain-containing protein n=1 Tax=Legionella pneumophila TaxID=446 RepID=UPI000D083F14|nr:methyltransferase domain-containing protein [Legionella pneumophila]HAU1605827.1 methyltransferase domain-containing protein [Legionella pneumophila]HAU1846302.1 methyltransferase domain-containing protein [Legionella pneumophila]